MNSIQQIVIKAIGEICSTILKVGMSDVGKLTKALQPVTAGITLVVLSLCAEQMDEALVVAAKSQRRLDGIQIKERDVKRTVMTNLSALHYKRTYFKLPDKTYAYLTDYLIGIGVIRAVYQAIHCGASGAVHCQIIPARNKCHGRGILQADGARQARFSGRSDSSRNQSGKDAGGTGYLRG